MQFIVTIDNGTATVPPRDEWRTIEAGSPREACLIYSRDHVQGAGYFKVLVVIAASYGAINGWAGCYVHAYDVLRKKEVEYAKSQL